MTRNDKEFISAVFNDNGYVLNFTNASFDSFTLNSVGVPVQSKYGLSKGKSLKEFIFEADDSLIIQLVNDLIEYSERFDLSIVKEKKFEQLKKLMNTFRTSNLFSSSLTTDASSAFNDKYIDSQLVIMQEMVDRSPTDAIGKAKELVESCFKHILDLEGFEYSSSSNLNELRKHTFSLLNLDANKNIDSKVNQDVKKLLNSFNTIIDCLSSLRNLKGDGHGKGILFLELDENYARLAINSSLTIVNFIWEEYKNYLMN